MTGCTSISFAYCLIMVLIVNMVDSMGSLEVGKKADLIVLDVMKPH